MFNYLKYRLKLYRLEKIDRKLSEKYMQADKRVSQKGQEDYMELGYLSNQQDEMQTWIEFFQTTYYQEKCEKFAIPLLKKEDGDYYYQFNFDDEEGDRDILTTEGFYKVRGLIRQEEKDRREIYGFWASAITGIIGGLIGFLTIIRMKF